MKIYSDQQTYRDYVIKVVRLFNFFLFVDAEVLLEDFCLLNEWRWYNTYLKDALATHYTLVSHSPFSGKKIQKFSFLEKASTLSLMFWLKMKKQMLWYIGIVWTLPIAMEALSKDNSFIDNFKIIHSKQKTIFFYSKQNTSWSFAWEYFKTRGIRLRCRQIRRFSRRVYYDILSI